MESNNDKKKRRSKPNTAVKDFQCECGKRYQTYQSLHNHKKANHSTENLSFKSPSAKPAYSKIQTASNEVENRDTNLAQIPIFENFHQITCRSSKQTCDDVLKEYLKKMRKKVNDEHFAALKCSMTVLRECINKNSHKIDSNYFLSGDLYTVTEKPDLIPNICNFFVLNYLPTEFPNHSKTDEVHFILEFCKWLNKKKYTDLEISMNY